MRTIAFVDTYYPDVLRDNPPNGEPRAVQMAKLCFGTSNFYSEAFKKMGWNAFDIIANDTTCWQDNETIFRFLLESPVDIVYCQDLCYFHHYQIREFQNRGKAVVGQISSKWPGDYIIKNYNLLFSSFPHYIPRFNSVGVRGEFLPIAFGEQVLNYVTLTNRDIDISFVGGLGSASNGGYWTQGTDLFEAVAKNFPTFKWWGYFIGDMSNYPSLRASFNGPAWGLDQYKIYARSKIVVNRHGEVAEGYTNNMRCFEATGMGACLITVMSKNLDFYFKEDYECVAYTNQQDLITTLRRMLIYTPAIQLAAEIAKAGQERTLKDHTYTQRLATIEPILRGLIK